MNAESENSNLSQHLMNGDNDFSLDSSQSARLDSPLNENKSFNDAKDSVSGVSSHHIEESTSRPKPPSNLQLSQEPKVYSPTTSASSTLQSSTQGYPSTAPLRRVDSRSFQPAPPQRPQNPLNFQPSQNWQSRSNSGQFSPVEYRPPPQQYQPSSQQYQPANQQYQSGQYQQSSQQYQPVHQYQSRSQPQFQQSPTSTADSTRKLSSFSPSSPTSPPLTSAPSPRPVVPGALNLRRASPWSLLREKFPPSDLTRPRLRSFQYPSYSSMNQQPIQTPPPPPPPTNTQMQQDIQRKPENEPSQRSYLPQESANKNIDMMRVRSPMMQNSGRDSPTMGTTQYSSPTPGQGPPSPRPPVPPMQRTDSMSAMRNDPRLQQPYAPRPPRSPNKFDDDDVIMGDPRMNLGRGSPRPPVPFNKFQGQDLPKNMTPPPGEPVKYMTRPETPDRSSPMNQTYTRSPMPNNYQSMPLGTPTPPNYGTPKMSPSPIMMGSTPQSYLSKSPNPSSTDRSSHESPNMMSGKSTPEQMSRTPEVPKASPTPPPAAPTKPPEVPTKPPETPSRSSTPSDRPSTPSKISPQSSNERPNTIRRSPSGRDTPFFNGVSSENSSGRTSRTESSQEGVLNAKNLEKSDENRSTPQRKRLISSSKSKDGDHDSGVDESTQGNEATTNGDIGSPKKSPTKIPAPKKLSMASPTKTPTKTTPKTPEAPSADKKKVPMNKVQVGAAPSPNLKTVTSKIGSLQNTSYKPGGGKVKIENRKLDWKAQPRIAAKNDTYTPGGGDKKETQPVPMPQPSVTIKPKKKASVSRNGEQVKKVGQKEPDNIQQVKLQWNAKSKIGSLENATHKPGGGDKKIESVKLDFKDKAKPKIGSKDNMKHVPGGGTVKNPDENGEPVQIEDQKLEIKASSKIGSLDNVKHRPGGGDKRIFDDKEYLKQMGTTSKTGSEGPSGTQGEDGASTDVSRDTSRQASRSRDRRQLSQSSIIREGGSSNQSGGHQSRKRTRDNKDNALNETNNNGVSTKKPDDVEEEDGTKKNEEQAGLEGKQETKECEEVKEDPQEENGTKKNEEQAELEGKQETKECEEVKEDPQEENGTKKSEEQAELEETEEVKEEPQKESGAKVDESVTEAGEKEKLTGETTVDDTVDVVESEATVETNIAEGNGKAASDTIETDTFESDMKEEVKDVDDKIETDKCESDVKNKEEDGKEVDTEKTGIAKCESDIKKEVVEEKETLKNGENKDQQILEDTGKQELKDEPEKVENNSTEEKEAPKVETAEEDLGSSTSDKKEVDTKENVGMVEEKKDSVVNEQKTDEKDVKEKQNEKLNEKVEKKQVLVENEVVETNIDALKSKEDKINEKVQNFGNCEVDSIDKNNEDKEDVKETDSSTADEQQESELKESVEKEDCKNLAESYTKEEASQKEATQKKDDVVVEKENELTKEEIAKTKEELNEVEIKEVDCKEMKNTSKQLENLKLDDGQEGVDEVDDTNRSQGDKSPEKLDTAKQVTDFNRDTDRSKVTEKPTQFDTNMIKTLEIGTSQVDSKTVNKPCEIDGNTHDESDKKETKSGSAGDETEQNKEVDHVKTDSKVMSGIQNQGDLKSNEFVTNAVETSSQKGESCDENDSKGHTAEVTNGNISTSTH